MNMFVSDFNKWVIAAHERYTICKKLIADSKNDPPTDPYRSKYQANEILKELCTELEQKWNSLEIPQRKLLYSLFKYESGLIAVETEEISAGCDALNISLDYVKSMANAPEGCHLTLKILNQLGIIWSERGENDKALEYLLQAESIYINFKSSQEICPYDCEDIFLFKNDKVRDWALFEKTFTHTLYYLAQVYELIEENEKAAKYCRKTLKRQRESGDFEKYDWAQNCATLSQYYVRKGDFEEARHLLCAASNLISNDENKSNQRETSNDSISSELQLAKASVSSNWVNYSIAVLEPKNGISERDVQLIDRLTSEKDVLQMESEIPIHVSSFEESKNIFLFAINHIENLKKYYTLNEYASNHAQIVRNHSSLYKYLAHYEPDFNRKCKMFKRRIDMLENVLKKLNPNFYLSLCRQLQYELGEIYFEIMDYKFKLLNSVTSDKHSSAIKKINLFITNGIDCFHSFLDSFKDKSDKIPDTFSEDDVRPVLIAYFYLGRFYTKLIENDTNRMLYNLSKSEECYKFIVQYIENNPNHLCFIEKELPVAKEMIELMPERMVQITGTTLF